MAPSRSAGESGSLGTGGVKPIALGPGEHFFVGGIGNVDVEGESDPLLLLKALIKMLKLMMIGVKGIIGGISGGSIGGDDSDDTNTRILAAAITNRNLWLNNRGSWIIIPLLHGLLLKLKGPEHHSVVFSLPHGLWHWWSRECWHILILVLRAKAVLSAVRGHRFNV